MEGIVVEQGKSRTGTPYVIRYPKDGDAESVWRYANRLSKERTFVRFQGEDISLEDETEVVQRWIRHAAEKKAITLLLVVQNEVQGICGADRKDKTESHVASLALSIDQSLRGQGLGEIFMRAVLSESERMMEGLKIFKLTYKAPNVPAKALYEKIGFKTFGVLPRGTQHQGEYVDEVFMYKEI